MVSKVLCRIRHNCSSLKADLHRVNIVPNPICDCGIDIENAGHYFFFCTQYNDQRDNLFSALNFIPFVNLDLLLNGSSDFNHELNKRAILAVIKYIKDTRRFTWVLSYMMPVIQILLVCIWNLDFVWTRVFMGCYGVKMKLYFHSKNI